MVAIPPLNANVDVVVLSNTPIAVGALPGGDAISETFPVGVPEDEVTFTVKLTVAPWAIVPVGEVVMAVVVELKVAEPHAFARFATLTDPSPVALSYPATAKKAGLFVLLGSTRTPYWFAAVDLLLQFVVLPSQATELFPVTTS
jgi:hypothetical protein